MNIPIRASQRVIGPGARLAALAALLAVLLPAAWPGRPPGAPVPAALPPRAAAPAGAARPNIVLVLADDLDARLGTLNYTPYIRDLLAHQGLTFSQALVPVSLCCPSRASLLRGQYVHNHQIYSNGPPDGGFDKAQLIGLEDSTIATVLQDAGYTTALVGKYLNGYPAENAETYIPPGWDEWASPSSDAAYLGYNYSMNINGVLVPFGNDPEDYMTDVLSRTAVNFITRTVAVGEPFFLYIGTYAPHGPSTPAPRHVGLFAGVEAPKGGSFNEADMSDKPPLISQLPLLGPAQIAELDEKYRKRLQSMQAVDEMVASLVATLSSTGVLSNTYFVFTSDNGYHLGQHRLPAGKYTNYEEDLRVPLVVRGPGVPISQTSSALVSTMDLAPTFAAIAGTTMPAYVDGRSLVDLLAGGAGPVAWRQVFFLEQYPFSSNVDDGLRGGLLEPPEPDDTWRLREEQESLCQSGIDPEPIYTGIRGVRYKYVEHHACDRELYDLLVDPFELNNIYSLAGDAVRQELHDWLAAMEACAAESCRSFELAPPEVLYLPLTRQ
jgi:arylsulfatase A-like enzyme